MSDWIYLASQSPRRAQLLEQLGVPHQTLLPTAEEDAEALELQWPGEGPDDYVRRVTANKLEAALRRRVRRDLPLRPVLCSDTTVALGAEILGKPGDDADALRILRQLSGQTHRVLTAVSLAWGEGQQAQAVSVSQVRFAAIPEAALRRYVASGEPMGKAGAYGVQGRMAGWIEHLEGSYSGIMGLPLFETATLLRRAGIDC